jgi:hypothetical protein
VHESVAALIADMDDPRFLGPILAILGEPSFSEEQVSRWWKPNMEAALKRILPNVRADHAPDLNDQQRSMLITLLAMPYVDVDLTLATLKALEQIGGAAAIPVVADLAAARAITPKTRRVREAALDCLTCLRDQAERAKLSRSLLRPAHETTQTLLRPVAEAPPDPRVEQLLRPHHDSA